MANEILVLTIEDRGDEGEDINVLFLYTLPAPIVVNSVAVALTPANTLPALVTDHGLLTAQEQTDLDNGDKAFSLATIKNRTGLSDAQVLQVARDRYNAIKTGALARFSRAYELSGNRYDALP